RRKRQAVCSPGGGKPRCRDSLSRLRDRRAGPSDSVLIASDRVCEEDGMKERDRFHASVLVLSALYILSGFMPPKAPSAVDLNGFGRLPVLNGGRIKPLDTIARTSLLMLSGKQTLSTENRSLSAREWLINILFDPVRASQNPVLEIDNPDVLGAI